MKVITCLLLALLLVLLVACNNGYSLEYNVYPSIGGGGGDDGDLCLSDGCRNLAFYVANSEKYFQSDTIFYFHPGTHYLKNTSLIELMDINNLTFQGLGKQEPIDYDFMVISTVKIDCQSTLTGFAFLNSSGIILRGLTFTRCGGHNDILGAIIHDPSTVYPLSFESVSSVVLESISVVNTTGVGVAIANCLKVQIHDSSFGFNRASSNCIETEFDYICGGGNVVMLYLSDDEDSEQLHDLRNISITNSNFSFGFTTVPGLSGGLTIDYEITSPLFVSYDGIVAYGNTGIQGGNFYFKVADVANFTLSVNNIVSRFGNAIYAPQVITDNDLEQTGAGFDFSEESFSESENRNIKVEFTNCEFTDGVAYSYGGLAISWLSRTASNVFIAIENCTFRNNTGREGAGLYIYAQRSLFTENLQVTMKSLHIDNNRGVDPISSVVNLGGGAFLQNLFIDSEELIVSNNELSGVVLINSILRMTGESTYSSNHGDQGGALAFHEASVLLLYPPVYVRFINNTANRRGGGIYVNDASYLHEQDCFYQLDNSHLNNIPRPFDATLFFDDNVAFEAGDVLFGGDVSSCFSFLGFSKLFVYPNQTGLSVISSNPISACFCNNESVPICDMNSKQIYIAPGQTFVTALAIVGQKFGVVSGILLINDMTDNESTLISAANLQPRCNNVSYAIKLTNEFQNTSNVYFAVERDNSVLVEENLINLQLNILPCPPGFRLDNITGMCTCIGELQNIQSVVCDVTTEEMSREGSVWMGYNDEYECTIVREDCPFDYCITDNVTFNITEPDPQCALNRAGVMCGACAEGYSLQLGTNSCAKCFNFSIFLLIVFILAGVAIVIIITFLNLTLSVGTINGLIFYSNIVKINEEIFFPNGPIPVLSQFISWINLDFGIECCFYEGMTALAKAWLQFVFPLYLWFLVILIILLARCSSKIAKLTGNNSLPVLATLILLSYAKLFRAIINVLIGTTIQCGSTSTLAWYIDPNVEYGKPSHLALVIIGYAFLFLLCLPYTIILLFNQLIIVLLASNSCVRLGCNRIRLSFRLFFDAYNAPYKPNWRFWTGILLTFRFIIVFVISLSSTNALLTTSLLLAIVFSIFAISQGVYKQKYLNWLEVWFLFNLLFVVLLVDKNNDKITEIATCVSISLVLVTFKCIIGYHLWLKLAETRFGKAVKAWVSKRYISRKDPSFVEEKGEYVKYDSADVVRSPDMRVTTLDMGMLRRETLLNSDSNADRRPI